MKVLLLEMRSTLKKHRPNLGLARISTLLKSEGHEIHYHVATKSDPFPVTFSPDRLYVSITFSWDIMDNIEILRNLFFWNPDLDKNTVIGGVATTRNRELITRELGIEPVCGCDHELDCVIPDPVFFDGFDETILFTSRGCGNNCSFCCVPHIEPVRYPVQNWINQIDLKKKNVTICDNNLLLSEPSHKRSVLEHLSKIAPIDGARVEGRKAYRTVSFDGGLDHRHLADPENIALLSNIRFSEFRLAFDDIRYEKVFEKSCAALYPILGQKEDGVYPNTKVFTLYNCPDTGDSLADTLYRVYKLRFDLGLLPWLMRYVPLDSMEYKKYLAPNWIARSQDAVDIGCWVNNRITFWKCPEYVGYFGKRKSDGGKVIYEGLSEQEMENRYGLKFFKVVDRLDFKKDFLFNKSLIEEQIGIRDQNMKILREL